jgi:signal transduction histidine kinase
MSEPTRARPWYSEISRHGRLRTKFLLSLLIVSASLTCSTLLVVRHRVELQVREQIREALESSVVTFQHFQGQREITLERSSAVLANVPILKALMTSHDPRTIEDGSTQLWQTIGSDLFVLADPGGRLMALHLYADIPEFSPAQALDLLQQSLRNQASRDWWFGGGHLFQVFLQPIYSGEPSNGVELGVLVLGYEINRQVVADVRQVASAEVAFRYGSSLVVSTLSAQQNEELRKQASLRPAAAGTPPVDIDLGQERFLATSTDLASASRLSVSLIVLKSYDQATAFLQSLNRWLAGLGLAAILAGSVLVYLISDTFTRPLARLVGGVHALEKGDFGYPLEARGNDEVSELTHSFDQMRRTLHNTQQELLNAERLATIGRMASTVSHDLRHSLTAILAYAEFLSERNLSESRRVEFYQEIRQAVTQMTDQLRALLEFSKDKLVYHPVHASVADIIHHSIHTVRARPEFRGIQITTSFENGCEGWFDAGRLERVFQNLLFNACEALPPEGGRIEVSTRQTPTALEIRVADNGGGIPEEIRATVFQPFVTSGKDNGIGLGLAVVQKILQEHNGEVTVERTGSDGTIIRVSLPAVPSKNEVATQNPA